MGDASPSTLSKTPDAVLGEHSTFVFTNVPIYTSPAQYAPIKTISSNWLLLRACTGMTVLSCLVRSAPHLVTAKHKRLNVGAAAEVLDAPDACDAQDTNNGAGTQRYWNATQYRCVMCFAPLFQVSSRDKHV